MQARAPDVTGHADACGVGRAVVVGLSRGARYAVELAALRPDLVAHIPNLRDPVRFNLLVREFAERVA